MDKFSKRFDQEGGGGLYSDFKEKEFNFQDGGGKDESTNSNNWKKLYLVIQLENKKLIRENKKLMKENQILMTENKNLKSKS